MQAWYPEPSDVQLLSTWHVTKVHLLQKFLDPQKHTLIDNILFLSKRAFSYLYVVNPLASHVSFYF
jgi:hypothetical protein